MARADSCLGDMPVIGIDTNDLDNPFWYVFGVVSHVETEDDEPCAVGGIRIGTKITPYLAWILDKMEE